MRLGFSDDHFRVHYCTNTVHRYAILVVHIDCGPNSCSSGIDWFRSHSVFSEAELFSTLCVSVMITFGGSSAALLISGQPLLRPWLPLAAILPAHCVCMRVRTPLPRLNQCVHGPYTRFLSPLCVWAICFLLLPCHRYDGLALLCTSTCCMRGAGSLPALLASSLSAPLTSFLCPLYRQKKKKRLTFRRAFYAARYCLFAFLASFSSVNLRLKCWGRLQLIFRMQDCPAVWNSFTL